MNQYCTGFLCSTGLTKPWSGDIANISGLLSALDARGFVRGNGERPEIILSLGGLEAVSVAVNLQLSYRKVSSLPGAPVVKKC